ncbi:MAG TPA: cyclic-di-AMP receptor [Anaerolineaceae bacterium]|nr:cyclic-di-AMP receptor [Anaerolineaceae bacterium]
MTAEKKIDKLLIAVVQSQDSDLVEHVLAETACVFGKLPSAGGFLRERNVTFLIGCSQDNVPAIKDLLASTAKRRVSYLATPIDNAPFPILLPTETVIGGANVFELDIDYFEEI